MLSVAVTGREAEGVLPSTEISVYYVVEAYEPYYVFGRPKDSCWDWHDVDMTAYHEEQATENARNYAIRQRRDTRVRRVTKTEETATSFVLGSAELHEYRGDPPEGDAS